MKIPTHVYHLFPLGALTQGQSISTLESWIPHLKSLQIDTLLLGPIFQSESHGYDVTDLRQIDARLGTWEEVVALVHRFHQAGIKVVLDAVWNHTSRNHFAYRSLCKLGKQSPYANWYETIDWNRSNGMGDSFTIQGWNGFQDLPKLNLSDSGVSEEILSLAKLWIDELDIDGVRLDAADVMDRKFLATLADHCHKLKPDFWMVGEVVHGDYRLWLEEAKLDSVTHYEGYKSLWSSFNDANFFELAYSYQRLFHERTGIYREQQLLLFTENHDVSRIASVLNDPAHLYPLHILHYTLPGIPSIYYGEEWGFEALKGNVDDRNLRPACPSVPPRDIPHPELEPVLKRLIAIRGKHSSLREGGYRQLHVANQQFAFARIGSEETMIIVINAKSTPVEIQLDLHNYGNTISDVLNPDSPEIGIGRNKTTIEISANWGRIFRVVRS